MLVRVENCTASQDHIDVSEVYPAAEFAGEAFRGERRVDLREFLIEELRVGVRALGSASSLQARIGRDWIQIPIQSSPILFSSYKGLRIFRRVRISRSRDFAVCGKPAVELIRSFSPVCGFSAHGARGGFEVLLVGLVELDDCLGFSALHSFLGVIKEESEATLHATRAPLGIHISDGVAIADLDEETRSEEPPFPGRPCVLPKPKFTTCLGLSERVSRVLRQEEQVHRERHPGDARVANPPVAMTPVLGFKPEPRMNNL